MRTYNQTVGDAAWTKIKAHTSGVLVTIRENPVVTGSSLLYLGVSADGIVADSDPYILDSGEAMNIYNTDGQREQRIQGGGVLGWFRSESGDILLRFLYQDSPLVVADAK